VGSTAKRIGALEEYIEGRVEERMREEIEALLDFLEARLAREEFIKVARIVAEAGDELGD
jgi:hypothetical protein